MSAVDVIAETLAAHEMYSIVGDPRKPTGWRCACGVVCTSAAKRLTHRAERQQAAVRGMSPADLAELTGGRVETDNLTVADIATAHLDPDGFHYRRRCVTPWVAEGEQP